MTRGWLGGALRGLYLLEYALMGCLLVAMVLVATTQIFLRNLFDTGLLWADPLLRVMLLWLGLLGAMAASHDDKHIAIDLLTQWLPERALPWVRGFTALFTSAICALVAWHCWRFVADEYQYGTPAFSGLPAWALELVIPIAFTLISARYLLLAGVHTRRAWARKRSA